MKFSVALSLLFAGLVSSQQLQHTQAQVDSFLRHTQHLKPSAQLISAKQNGSFSTVTYQDGPMSVKYQVKTENNQMKVVGIQQIVSLQSNLKFRPVSIEDVPLNPIDIQLPPLPLLMPQFVIESNGELSSRNIFDEVQKEMEKMQRKMHQDQENFRQMMEKKRLELQQRIIKKIEMETPLLGAGNHDFIQTSKIERNQQLIGGGDHDQNWATQMDFDHPIADEGDHDYAWMTVQIEPNQKLLRADDRDYDPQLIPQGQLIGGGQHDNWVEMKNQFDFPQIGGDDHDNWKLRKEKFHQRENHKKERRHHSRMDWMNRVFTNEEIRPLLKEKLPDMMKNSEVVSVQNKGFIWRKGFPLDIQIKEKDGKMQTISAFFKPRNNQFLIDKISSIQKIENQNILPVELTSDSKAEKNQVPEEKLVAPKEDSNPQRLGGKKDPDNSPQFLNLVKEIQFVPNNHMSKQRKEDHSVEEVHLLGGPSDPDHDQKAAQDIKQKNQSVFDVTGLPLPGGETDIDHGMGLEIVKPKNKDQSAIGKNIGLDMVKKAIQIVKDIAEEDVVDIEEVQEPKSEAKKQKLQHLVK